MPVPHLNAIRVGAPYESLDRIELADFRSGAPVASVSQINGGIVRRDVAKFERARQAFSRKTAAQMLEICARAGELFLSADLPCGSGGQLQSPQKFIEQLSATTALPHRLCANNMRKLHHVCTNMRSILDGLTRGLDISCIDRGVSFQRGRPMSFFATAQALGVILPSNSPGVHSLWLPALALKIPVVLKPGREEPWTAYRLIQAFLGAGCPAEAFSFYPTDHDGADAIIKNCGRVLLFGDATTTARYASDPRVQVHGPGHSKVVIGEDEVDAWPKYVDVLAASIADNGGRSCINASTIVVPRHGREIAVALAERLGPVAPVDTASPEARLAGFANAAFAESIDNAIEAGLAVPGAEDVTARNRGGARLVKHDGGTYLRPTIVFCASAEHPLAHREFLFPFASVVEIPQEKLPDALGNSLVVTVISNDEAFRARLLGSPLISRINLGPLPTSHVEWDQPHEGNLFEFLYQRRAVQVADAAAFEPHG